MIKSETPRPFFVASVYAFRGESDEALKWLDTAYALREIALPLLKSQSMFGELEGDPRYKALLKKMKLPEWRRKREVMFRRPCAVTPSQRGLRERQGTTVREANRSHVFHSPVPGEGGSPNSPADEEASS